MHQGQDKGFSILVLHTEEKEKEAKKHRMGIPNEILAEQCNKKKIRNDKEVKTGRGSRCRHHF
mgnify:CR=1 FL=1